jgi:hypothetical protein
LATELAEFARVAKAEHRIEECIQRAKSEAGLADYEWKGWHHHQTLSLLATWFLITEARRGENGPRRLPSNKSAKASPTSFTADVDALQPPKHDTNANNGYNGTNWHACIIGNGVTAWLHST